MLLIEPSLFRTPGSRSKLASHVIVPKMSTIDPVGVGPVVSHLQKCY
jgi:hypothetical protein